MALSGATFDENSVPPWTRGGFRGVLERLSLPPTRKTTPPELFHLLEWNHSSAAGHQYTNSRMSYFASLGPGC